MLAAVLSVAVAACGKPTRAQVPTRSKAEIHRAWDGTSSLALPDGRRFSVARPLLWISHGDTNVLDPSEEPFTERCLLLARGVPYLLDSNELSYGFEAATENWPRAAVARRDLCVQALGSGWRLPTIDELQVIAPHVAASIGIGRPFLIAYAKDARGELKVYDYVVPDCVLEGPCDRTPQVSVTDANNAQVVCLGPNDAPADRSPSLNELNACVQRFAFFLETNYRMPHRTIDPDLVDLIAAVHATCTAGSDLSRWRELTDRLDREKKKASSERVLSNEANYIELRLAWLDQAAHHPMLNGKNQTDCQSLPEGYARKCALGTGNSSCLALQLTYAIRCKGADPEARIEAVRSELLVRLELVRRSRRRVATLDLAIRKAQQCLTASAAARSAEQGRLAAQLAALGEANAPPFGEIPLHFCTCAVADLECALDSLRKPEACPTQRPTREPKSSPQAGGSP